MASNWTVGFLTTVGIFAIVALALNVQWGYTGVFNFGIVAFFMVGAYTSAILTLDRPGAFEDYVGGFSLPVPIGWLAAMGAAGVLALLIGLPTLRLRRDFLAIATIGVAAILRSVANSIEGLVNRGRGLNGIPRFLDEIATGEDYRWVLLGIVLVMLALVYLLVRRATGSPWGRVLRAIRENEDTAKAAGKDTVNFRMQSFVLGGMIMGPGWRDLGAPYRHHRPQLLQRPLRHLPGLGHADRGRERQQPRRRSRRPLGRFLLVRHAAVSRGPAGLPGHARLPGPPAHDRPA